MLVADNHEAAASDMVDSLNGWLADWPVHQRPRAFVLVQRHRCGLEIAFLVADILPVAAARHPTLHF
jgi:hypothetical protein